MNSTSVGVLPPPAWGSARPGASVLVIHSEEGRRLEFAEALRKATGVLVESTATLPSEDQGWDLVTVDAQAVPPEHTDAVFACFPKQHAAGRLIIRLPSSDRRAVRRWFERGARHLICQDEPHAQQDLVSAARKLLWGGANGPECYLQPGARTWSLDLAHSNDKAQVLGLCSELDSALSLGKPKRQILETVVEEFVTNALYNAPVDDEGVRRFAHLNRKEAVALGAHETVCVVLACDDHRLAISVTDRFGSLPPATVPSYLSKCLVRGDDQVNDHLGGAGLGLYFVYQAISHLAVNVAPGRRTEMIGFIDLGVTAGTSRRRAHSFGLFVTP